MLTSLAIANSSYGDEHHHLLSGINTMGNFNINMIVNDFLMAIFFLFVGLEIKHEILGENLLSIKKASFPIIGAIGGVVVPSLIFLLFNYNTGFISGTGIPISTDIAFAIGVFYSSGIKIGYLILSAITLGIVILMNKKEVDKITLYLLGSLVLWAFIYASGVHATISGILVAIAIPHKKLENSNLSMRERLEHKLVPIFNLIIMPLFALVNTAIDLRVNIDFRAANTLIVGIVMGLVVGKPLGIMLFTTCRD